MANKGTRLNIDPKLLSDMKEAVEAEAAKKAARNTFNGKKKTPARPKAAPRGASAESGIGKKVAKGSSIPGIKKVLKPKRGM